MFMRFSVGANLVFASPRTLFSLQDGANTRFAPTKLSAPEPACARAGPVSLCLCDLLAAWVYFSLLFVYVNRDQGKFQVQSCRCSIFANLSQETKEIVR